MIACIVSNTDSTAHMVTNQLDDQSFMSRAICHGFRPNEIWSSQSRVSQNNLESFCLPLSLALPLPSWPGTAGASTLAVKRLRPKTSMQFESYVACLCFFLLLCRRAPRVLFALCCVYVCVCIFFSSS